MLISPYKCNNRDNENTTLSFIMDITSYKDRYNDGSRYSEGRIMALDIARAFAEACINGDMNPSDIGQRLLDFTLGSGWEFTEEGRGYRNEALRILTAAGGVV